MYILHSKIRYIMYKMYIKKFNFILYKNVQMNYKEFNEK